MTFVTDQLVHLDAHLDRLQLEHPFPTSPAPPSPFSTTFAPPVQAPRATAHARSLQKLIKALSATSTRPLSPWRIVSLLQAADISGGEARASGAGEHSGYEAELEWLLVSKAAIQTYGIVLHSLVGQTLPLAEDMFYWDEVSSSHTYTALYSLQTSPWRVVRFAREVFAEAVRRLKELREMERIPVLKGPYNISNESLAMSLQGDSEHEGWLEAPAKGDSLAMTGRKFYALVRGAVRERRVRMGALSPFAMARQEIRRKQEAIGKMRGLQASALGVLIGEDIAAGLGEREEWKGTVERVVQLMENVVRNVSDVDHSLDEFEETVFGAHAAKTATPTLVSTQLQAILTKHLPAQASASAALTATHGRPGTLTRYWLPATALLLSSTTILRILVNRQAELASWLADVCTTTLDFWRNWVVTPTRSIIHTIRHSEASEVALLSRRSLTADMDSLERMVVDFARDDAASAGVDMDALRLRVKEGDLTPVLRAYERDLRRPLRGAIRGELVRALLIQVQKTKVDVEVAISGIDRLLRSQELVFGFVGLTPGVLVCVGAYRWLRAALGGRRGRASMGRAGRMVRTMRNVDRILSGGGEVLSYKEHGLLLCEVHVLREFARGVLPRGVGGEFVEDCEELVDVRGGVRRQVGVLGRMRWAYAKWIG